MLRGSRPTVALAASLVVLSGALAACGGGSTPGTGLDFGDRLDAVSVEGEVGAAKIAFEQRMSATGLESETLEEGTGEPLADDDKVFVNYAFGNGFTRTTTIDTFGEDAAATELTVGAEPTAEPASLDDVVKNVLADYIKAGVTRGTRIAITGDTPAFFPGADMTQLGQILASEGIGNDDGLVMVADVMDVEVLSGPEGKQAAPPAWAPALEFDGSAVTGLDFTGVAKPGAKDKLLWAELKQGTGEEVAKGDLVVVDYLGQVHGAAKPFDESYSAKKSPMPTPIGLGAVIPGWDQVLVGKSVGSRIVMRIPPAKGYADQKKPGIPAGSTLYFVADILAAV